MIKKKTWKTQRRKLLTLIKGTWYGNNSFKSRVSKEQLEKMMADRNHPEMIAVARPSIPSPPHKQIIQVTEDQMSQLVINLLLKNNAIRDENAEAN